MNKHNSHYATTAHRQHGAALLSTLLIVALITITLAAISSRQHRAIQLAGNRQAQLQLRNLLTAGETFAIATLRRDKVDAERNNSDSTEDFWAQSLPPVPVDGATIEGCIVDLQGKYNLNNLVSVVPDQDGFPRRVVNQEEFQMLQRLLTALAIDVTKADAIKDWIDTDIDVTGTDGAEDDFYTGQEPPYRTANGPMVSPSELLLVKGFRVIDEGGLDDYETLAPHITTIPDEVLAINVNTASSAVISAIDVHMPAISDEIKVVDDEYWESYPDCPEGGGLLDALTSGESGDDPDADPGTDSGADPDAQEDDGFFYQDIEDFKQNAFVSEDDNLDDIDDSVIATSSTYYMSRVTVTRDDIVITQYSILRRESNGSITTLRRSRGTL